MQLSVSNVLRQLPALCLVAAVLVTCQCHTASNLDLSPPVEIATQPPLPPRQIYVSTCWYIVHLSRRHAQLSVQRKWKIPFFSEQEQLPATEPLTFVESAIAFIFGLLQSYTGNSKPLMYFLALGYLPGDWTQTMPPYGCFAYHLSSFFFLRSQWSSSLRRLAQYGRPRKV